MKKILALLFALWGAPAFAVDPSTVMPDANYSATTTDIRITTSALSAARTLTLPYAGGTCIGQTCGATALEFVDANRVVTSSNTVTITPQTGDTINGSSSSLVVNFAGARVVLFPITGTNWFVQIMSPSGQIVGTATNDNACAGCVGEVITSTVVAGSAVSLTTATAANVTSVSLTPGDWDCRATVARTLGASTSVTKLVGSISTTTGTVTTQGLDSSDTLTTAANVMGATGTDSKVGLARQSLAATTTVFLVAQDTFTVSTDAAYGTLTCRRAR
jgi:hypothetical protein